MTVSNSAAERRCWHVTSRGKTVKLSLRGRVAGYGFQVPEGDGGRVEEGFGEVRA